jgi:hypothetical protein
VKRNGWGKRIAQLFRWQPATYGQVWLFAVFGFGVPGFIIWSVVGTQLSWPSAALSYAASVTFFGGLAQSWRLNRRRQRGH